MSPSRRRLFEAAALALAGAALAPEAASAQAPINSMTKNESVVLRWYRLWETDKKDWGPFDAILADDFTFTSAAPDDHISKAAFKTNCWDTQIAHVAKFELERMMAQGDSVFVKYLCHTTTGQAFRNVELLRLRNGRIESIECYFGGPGYATATEAQKR
jgi:ketosteroid isomerase-like protein